MKYDLVYWSVNECNKKAFGKHKPMGRICPDCGMDDWEWRHGVDPEFASEFNPGEYVDFICVGCGHLDHESC